MPIHSDMEKKATINGLGVLEKKLKETHLTFIRNNDTHENIQFFDTIVLESFSTQ